MQAGWNMISSCCLPSDLALSDFIWSLSANLEVLKSARGQVYWPRYNIDAVGSWSHLQGYQVYLRGVDTLHLPVYASLPEVRQIPLGQGWNLTPYLRSSSAAIGSMLSSISNELVIVKNNANQVYWPTKGINTIESMSPGQGYMVYVNQNTSLVYPSDTTAVPSSMVITGSAGSKSSSRTLSVTGYYKPEIENTGVSAILLLEPQGWHDGDEAAVKNTMGEIVGCGVVTNGKSLITVWGKNPLVQDVEGGAAENEVLTLERWNSATGQTEPIEIDDVRDVLRDSLLRSELAFKSDAVWTVSVGAPEQIPVSFALEQNYPNPFNPSTLIQYAMPVDGHVSIKVYDILGRVVRTLVDEVQTAGYKRVTWNGTDDRANTVPSGVYFYRMQAGDFSQVHRLMLLK